jgi:hypothetical protein
MSIILNKTVPLSNKYSNFSFDMWHSIQVRKMWRTFFIYTVCLQKHKIFANTTISDDLYNTSSLFGWNSCRSDHFMRNSFPKSWNLYEFYVILNSSLKFGPLRINSFTLNSFSKNEIHLKYAFGFCKDTKGKICLIVSWFPKLSKFLDKNYKA